ncbi:MAG: addiction module protein [Actinomycetaceae bacterium]|nr:addiction module protein [Actinomycetaceae bacterium]
MSITSHALALPVDQRIELASLLWDSIGEDLDAQMVFSPEDLREFNRRLDAHEAGIAGSTDWQSLRQELSK